MAVLLVSVLLVMDVELVLERSGSEVVLVVVVLVDEFVEVEEEVVTDVEVVEVFVSTP